jgi:CBS domain-containing protein
MGDADAAGIGPERRTPARHISTEVRRCSGSPSTRDPAAPTGRRDCDRIAGTRRRVVKVHELMSAPVETCSTGADLAAAAMIMWRNDCGVVPVTEGSEGRVVGVITDRDICMAAATRHCSPDQIRVGDVIRRGVHAVRPDDDVQVALDTLARERVRRLPVLGARGEALGIVSLADLVRHAAAPRGRVKPPLATDAVLQVLRAVGERRHATAMAGATAQA